jgi:hypothetical protein
VNQARRQTAGLKIRSPTTASPPFGYPLTVGTPVMGTLLSLTRILLFYSEDR